DGLGLSGRFPDRLRLWFRGRLRYLDRLVDRLDVDRPALRADVHRCLPSRGSEGVYAGGRGRSYSLTFCSSVSRWSSASRSSGPRSTPIRGIRRCIHFGNHQFASRSSSMVDGTRTIRTRVASTRMATASPSPISLI